MPHYVVVRSNKQFKNKPQYNQVNVKDELEEKSCASEMPERCFENCQDYAAVESIKDGAYYCYCAYVLRISRYSDFLSAVLTNAGIFLRGSKLCGESRTQQVFLVSK